MNLEESLEKASKEGTEIMRAQKEAVEKGNKEKVREAERQWELFKKKYRR